MYSGGIPLTPADKSTLEALGTRAGELNGELSGIKDEMGPLYDDLNGGKDTLSDLAGDKSDRGQDYTKGQEGYKDAKELADLARADHRTEKGEARQEELRVRGKEEARTAFERQKEDRSRSLITQGNESGILQRRADFLRQANATEIFDQYELACTQVICENQRFGGEYMVCMYNASRILNAAKTGIRTNASAEFKRPTYLNAAIERVRPTHIQAQNEADGQKARVQDAQAHLDKMVADTYNDDALIHARGDAAKAVAERDTAKVDFDRKDVAAKAAKGAREGTRVAYTDAEKAERAQQRIIRDYERSIQEKTREAERKSAEIAENGRERQGIIDKTYVKA